MTIESDIQKLTVAITELTAALYGVAGVAKTTTTVAKAEEPKKEKAAAKTKAIPAPEAENVDIEVEAKNPAVEYSTVRDKVLSLIKLDPNNRAKVIAKLEPFGVTTAKDLKPAQYAKALEALNSIEE